MLKYIILKSIYSENLQYNLSLRYYVERQIDFFGENKPHLRLFKY